MALPSQLEANQLMKRVVRLFPWRRLAPTADSMPERYARSPEGRAILRLHLSSPSALLMPFERFPADFKGDAGKPPGVLDLNKDLVDYLFARLAELGDEALLLRVTLAASEASEPVAPVLSTAALQAAIWQYFAYLESVRRQNLEQLIRDVILLGLLGLGALALSIPLEARVAAHRGVGIALPLLSQGVTVFGWLTFWEALANALWNWRPLYRQLRMCQRLQQAQLELELH